MSKKTKDQWVRIIDVSDPFLHEKGYTLYKVTSKVFPKNSVEAVTEVTVWKRYNDFKKLHKALSTLHQNLYLKETFPPFAKTQFFGRFDPGVIEERRKSALALLQFAANCSPLFTSQVFVKFFEDGQLVEKSKQNSPQLENFSDILQPLRDELPIQKNCLIPEVIEKKLCASTEESNGHENLDSGKKEPFGSLGGIWQHHQVADNISLGSHGTDDDDHTTFTDDDTSVSRTSINLSEFDPILAGNNGIEQKLTDQENMCNSWLLSALQSCTSTDVEKDLENILEFPTPFHEFEDFTSGSESQSAASFISNAKESHFPFDNSVPAAEERNDNSEFDPVLNNSQPNTPKDISHDEQDSYNYDRFAMTPSAYDKEPIRRPSYIMHASQHVKFAQEAEASARYKEAFELYKKAIDILLQGFQKDKSPELKDIVRKKVLFYLMRAEELYENKLPKENLDVKSRIETPNVSLSPGNTVSKLQGNVQELEKYKVLGVLDKVLLVLDVSTNNTFIVKTLYKSSNPKNYGMTHIVPQNVPFMVKLYRIYETNYALFLILEHATGGRLWDYVSSFLQRSPLSPCNDGTCLYVESKTKADLCNVYSGKKVCDAENANSEIMVDPDLTSSENCSSSYVALFQKYADAVDQENVPLAKYHKEQVAPKEKTSEHMVEAINDINKQMNLLQPQKPIRNRLSSSTGSLDTTFSQKSTNLDALNALDDVASQASSKLYLPESCINLWAAEIILALESLHDLGIIWMDFHPDNILLGAEGHILLTYQSQWKNIDFVINKSAKENLFCAPEVGNIFPVSPDCDWWSLGAILFELLTGQSLVACHPTGITRHTVLNFPTTISSNAKDFISKLLQYNPTERLGSGIYGIEEIKGHPFMRDIDWKALQR